LLAAALAIVMFPTLGVEGTLITVGAVFVLWTPVLPALVRRTPQIDLDLDMTGVPLALKWGAASEPVTVLSASELGYRLELEDGSVIDVRRARLAPGWTLIREREG